MPVLIAASVVAAGFFPAQKAGSKTVSSVAPIVAIASPAAVEALDKKAAAEAAGTALYDSLRLGDLGLSKEALIYAYTGYLALREKGALANENILSICDFSQSSFKKRLYILDVKNFRLLKKYLCGPWPQLRFAIRHQFFQHA